jgi:hypothetical protein
MGQRRMRPKSYAQAEVTYVIAPISSIEGTGLRNSITAEGNFEFKVSFSYQPCSQYVEGVAITRVGPISSAVERRAVAVVLRDKGIRCLGPTQLVSEVVKFKAADFPVGGVRLAAVQPGSNN